MIWMDFTIEQSGSNFKIIGDWEGEVMGLNKDNSKKESFLYKPGDTFKVDKNGWLCKVENTSN